MDNQFQFYEVVIVTAADEESVVGQAGTILGMARDDESGGWSYAVFLESTGRVWSFLEDQLTYTGRRQCRADFYPGDSPEGG
jgi:Immunity protein 31